MPIWMLELARWLGMTNDSRRPNVGALLLALAVALLAMGYKPEDVATFGGSIAGMAKALAEFVAKPDNALGGLLGAAGFLMFRGTNGESLSAEEVATLRAQLAAMARRRAAPPPELET